MRFFVSGPITPRDCTPREAVKIQTLYVDEGIRVGIELMRKGHFVFIPHLSFYVHIHPSNDVLFPLDYFYQYDFSIIKDWANALFYISTSPGVEREVEFAEAWGIPIYRNLDDVPEAEPRKDIFPSCASVSR